MPEWVCKTIEQVKYCYNENWNICTFVICKHKKSLHYMTPLTNNRWRYGFWDSRIMSDNSTIFLNNFSHIVLCKIKQDTNFVCLYILNYPFCQIELQKNVHSFFSQSVVFYESVKWNAIGKKIDSTKKGQNFLLFASELPNEELVEIVKKS